MKITRKELKELIKEQVGLMVPPGSNMEEQREPETHFKGMDLFMISDEVGLAAAKLFKENWKDNDFGTFRTIMQDIEAMWEIKNHLRNGKVNAALTRYRALDTAARDAFPPSMWRLSKLESSKRVGGQDFRL